MAICRQCSVRPSVEGLMQAGSGSPVYLCQQCLESNYGPGKTVSMQSVSAQEQLARIQLNAIEQARAQEEFNEKANMIVYPIIFVICLIIVIAIL